MPDLVDLAYCRAAVPLLASTSKFPDTTLSHHISAVSEQVTLWCGRKFLTEAFTNVLLDGTGDQLILLPEFPLVSIQQVQVRRWDGTFDTIDVTQLFFETDPFRSDGEVMFQPSASGAYNYFPRGKNNIIVNYTAGLGAAIANLPESLKMGVALWVAHSASNSKKDLTLKSEAIGKYRRERIDPAVSALNPEFAAQPPDEARKYLSSYRKMHV